MQKRKVSDSEATLSEVMMPLYANHYGSVHGGVILKLVDEAAFVAASKHARKNVVVASMDYMEFKHPVNVGDVLILHARLLHVGRTSMDIEVKVEAEKIKQGRKVNVGCAYLTMVALDKKGRPAPVPGLILETAEHQRKNKEIRLRRERRLIQLRGQMPNG